MIVLIHVVIALSSLALATAGYTAPSVRKLHLTYALVAATLSSGAYLVWSSGSPLLSSCVSGLVYLSVVAMLATLGRRKLALAVRKNS